MDKEIRGLNELALFVGGGGGVLGGYLLGWRTVCAVECDDHSRRVLLARQRDGFLPRFPIWDDVETFEGSPWRGRIDVVSGGFPCQGISSIGSGKGLSDERSGLWREMARIISEVEPGWVFVENSPTLTSRGLGIVLRDLAKMGYNAEWGVLGAKDFGMQHQRERIWVVAKSKKVEPRLSSEREGRQGFVGGGGNFPWDEVARGIQENWDQVESGVGRVADGVANRLDRLARIGNGQVPAVAAGAFRILSERLINNQVRDVSAELELF